MSDYTLTLTIVGGIVAFILSFAVGANDSANALGTSVGSRALTLKQAVTLGGIFEFLGVFTMGAFVSNTLKSKVLSPDDFDDQVLYVIGMFSAMCASALLLLAATWFGLPVSTTQTIVGGIIGFGLVTVADSLKPDTLISIGLSWVITPILGFVLGYAMYWLVERFILSSKDPLARSQRAAPFITSATLGILGAFIASSQRKIWKFSILYVLLAFVVSSIIGFVLHKYIQYRRLHIVPKQYTTSNPNSPAARDELEFAVPHSQSTDNNNNNKNDNLTEVQLTTPNKKSGNEEESKEQPATMKEIKASVASLKELKESKSNLNN